MISKAFIQEDGKMNRSICVLVVAVLSITSFSLTGCGPSKEERTVMEQFNQLPELIEKGGYIKKLDRFEGQEEKVFEVEAEIVNEEGIAIGRLRSERVEGFGTRKPRIQWYEKPGVPEEWKMPERGRGRRGQRGQDGQQQADGQQPAEKQQPTAQ